MFQYAAAKSIAYRIGADLFYDQEYFLSPEKFGSHWQYQLNLLKTNIEPAKILPLQSFVYLIYRIIRKLSLWGFSIPRFFFENKNGYDFRIQKINSSVWMDGYFQSEKYFKTIRSEILKEFQPRIELDEVNKKIAENMKQTNSISLHVRRGDYVTNSAASQVHGTCNGEYYQKAIAHFEEMSEKSVFYIFSDDLSWAKENIKINSEVHYVDQNTGTNSYRDLFLMSQCKHHIIANSSFSWWGAWLNSNSKKTVIAPKRWYLDPKMVTDDIYPEEWLRF